MRAKSNLLLMTIGLIAFGGTIVAAPTPAVAAPLVGNESTVQSVSTSLLVPVALPDGANRATDTSDLAKFTQALQSVATNHHGKITRTEVLAWTGDAAKTAIPQLSTIIKEKGYLVTEAPASDSEAGRVTPIAVTRDGETGSVIGMWIETKDDVALLIWGHFDPDMPVAKKAIVKPKTTVAAKAKKTAAASVASKTGKTQSDVERRAKAIKAYEDYQYVKMMGPISGPMYRSTKW